MSIESQPISKFQWIHRDRLRANDYNPNQVAPRELGLLKLSIMEDNWTQPIVTVHDPDNDLYVIVDGFHRYFVSGDPEVSALTGGRVPVVVLNKPLSDRMASTVRHNRARGKHKVTGMSGIVFGMLREGCGDAEICNKLGMEPDELLRLKHITGYAKLYGGVKSYSREYLTNEKYRKPQKKRS